MFNIKAVEYLDKIIETVSLTFDDTAITHRESDLKYVYSKYVKRFKEDIIDNYLTKLSKILSDRFNVNIILESTNSLQDNNGYAYVILPVLDPVFLNRAFNDFDSLFPKKRYYSVLWNIIATKDEKIIYDTTKNIVDDLKSGGIELDLENLRVKRGLKNSNFLIRIDFLYLTLLGLTATEMLSIILHEVGHIFTYLEYMFLSIKSTISLLENYLVERFGRNRSQLKSLQLAFESVGLEDKIDTPLAVVPALDAIMVKVYKLDTKKGSINIDFERLADSFVVKLGMEKELTDALVKITTNGVIRTTSRKEHKTDSLLIDVLTTIFYIISSLLFILVFNIFGILLLGLLLGVKVITYLIKLFISVIFKIFYYAFGSDTNTEIKYDDIVKRLDKIRLTTIKKLRQLENRENSDSVRVVIVNNVLAIEKSIELIKSNYYLVYPKDRDRIDLTELDNREIINQIVENLEDNELYLFSNRIGLSI